MCPSTRFAGNSRCVPLAPVRFVAADLFGLQKADFTRFDYIIGMDSMNMSNIEKAKPANSTAKSTQRRSTASFLPLTCAPTVALFGSFGDGKVIQDPYVRPEPASDETLTDDLLLCPQYGGKDGFEKTYKQCVQYSEGLLKAMGYDDASGGKL